MAMDKITLYIIGAVLLIGMFIGFTIRQSGLTIKEKFPYIGMQDKAVMKDSITPGKPIHDTVFIKQTGDIKQSNKPDKINKKAIVDTFLVWKKDTLRITEYPKIPIDYTGYNDSLGVSITIKSNDFITDYLNGDLGGIISMKAMEILTTVTNTDNHYPMNTVPVPESTFWRDFTWGAIAVLAVEIIIIIVKYVK